MEKKHGRPVPSRTSSKTSTFTRFLNLPVEIRLRVWWYSTPLSPRIIQVYFDPKAREWSAKNFTGGLPALIHVNQEARNEALRGLTRAFDAFVDLDRDTIYANDPAIGLRRPMLQFAHSEPASEIRHLAIDLFSYSAWSQNSSLFPQMSPSPAKVIRTHLRALQSFSLVLCDDESIDYEDADQYDESENEYDEHELDWRGEQSLLARIRENLHPVAGPNGLSVSVPHQVPEIPLPGPETEEHDALRMETLSHFDALEHDELQSMAKLYHPNTRNVHFSNAGCQPSYVEECWYWTSEIRAKFREEKDANPVWVRPTISILLLEEGLNQPDCSTTGGVMGFPPAIHSHGDHKDIFGVTDDESEEEEDGDADLTNEIIAALLDEHQMDEYYDGDQYGL